MRLVTKAHRRAAALVVHEQKEKARKKKTPQQPIHPTQKKSERWDRSLTSESVNRDYEMCRPLYNRKSVESSQKAHVSRTNCIWLDKNKPWFVIRVKNNKKIVYPGFTFSMFV